MAKKSTKVSKELRREVLNFEVILVLLVGVIVIISTAAIVLYTQREMLTTQVTQLEQVNTQMNSLYTGAKIMPVITPTPTPFK